jgi:hypothetical protein
VLLKLERERLDMIMYLKHHKTLPSFAPSDDGFIGRVFKHSIGPKVSRRAHEYNPKSPDNQTLIAYLYNLRTWKHVKIRESRSSHP